MIFMAPLLPHFPIPPVKGSVLYFCQSLNQVLKTDITSSVVVGHEAICTILPFTSVLFFCNLCLQGKIDNPVFHTPLFSQFRVLGKTHNFRKLVDCLSLEVNMQKPAKTSTGAPSGCWLFFFFSHFHFSRFCSGRKPQNTCYLISRVSE